MGRRVDGGVQHTAVTDGQRGEATWAARGQGLPMSCGRNESLVLQLPRGRVLKTNNCEKVDGVLFSWRLLFQE